MNDDFVRRSDILEFKRTLYRVRYGTGYQSIEDTEAVEIDDIESVPAIDMRPVVRGEWKKSYADHESFGVRPFFRYCSECHESTVYTYNFCPNCGADMRGEQ